MLTALELERTARIRLQELLARDWTLQAAALKRCFYEQDVVLEVALHKLEVHAGCEEIPCTDVESVLPDSN